MDILFLDYRRGVYRVRSGKLVDSYVDSWKVIWHEIAVEGGFVNVTDASIVRNISDAA